MHIMLLLLMILLVIFAYRNLGIPAFLYHSISNDSNVTPDLFKEHLDVIKNKKMVTITMDDLLNGKTPHNSILITFDDGYKDNYDVVFPMLKEYKMKATIFLNTAYMDKSEKFLTWDNIKEMYESGYVDFQCHSHNHYGIITKDEIIGFTDGKNYDDTDLNIYGEIKDGYPIFPRRGEYSDEGIIIKKEFFDIFRDFYYKELKSSTELSNKEKLKIAQEFIDKNKEKYFHYEDENDYRERIISEFTQNKNAVEQHLDKKVTFFCWPWGHRNKKAQEILKSLGIKGFVTTKKGTNAYKPDFNMIKRVELRKFTTKKFKINLFICRNLILGKLYSIVS